MQLANRAICPTDKELKQNRKKHHGTFERVMVHSKGKRRYYSEHPAILLGEALRTRFEKTSEPMECLVFFQPFEDNWYACVINQGEVEAEYLTTLNELEKELGYWLHTSNSLFVASDETLDFYQEKQIPAEPLKEADWQGYILTAQTGTPKRWIALLVIVLTGLALGWLSWDEEKPALTHIIERTAEQIFIESLQSKPLASPAIQKAMKIILETRSMPRGMEVGKVTFNEEKLLVARLHLEARDKVVREYFQSTPTVAAWLDEERTQLTVETPKATHWQAYNISQYLVEMRDALELAGVTVIEAGKRDAGDISIVTLNLKTSGLIGKLPLIIQVLDAPFVTTTQLSLSWNEEEITELSLEIEVQGEML